MAKELTTSALSNCVDSLNILRIPSTFVQNKDISEPTCVVEVPIVPNTRKKPPKSNNDAIESIDRLLNQPFESNDSDFFTFDECDITIAYLAGIIEKRFYSTRTNCEECKLIMPNIFKHNSKVHTSVQTKNSQMPCKSTVQICRIANDYLKRHAFKIEFKYNRLLNEVLNEVLQINLYEETDFKHEPQHKSDLVRFVVEEFFRYRATYIARKITLNEKQKMLRRKNRKLVHFLGE